MRRWLPDTTQGQIVAILLGALLATFVLLATLLTLARPAVPPLPPGPWPGALQIAAVIEALHAAPVEARSKIAQAVSTERVRVEIGSTFPCPDIAPGRETQALRLILGALLDNRLEPLTIRHCGAEPGTEDSTQIELPLDGATLSLRNRDRYDFPQTVMATLPLIVAVSFLLVLVIVLSLWTLWRINRPLRNLAGTVEKFGLEVAVAPLREQGPREIRLVAQTFNRMQERIARSVEERSRMLMTIGHDLRTPMTRLKLRIELDETLSTRRDLLHDLDLMHKMVNGALSFLNDRSEGEATEEVDLGALVESICIEFTEAGKQVAYAGVYGPNCRCQPTAITRAINNLIENGCRYGTYVVADVWRMDEHAVIEIQDDGPGIPSAMRDVALLPFARLDPARAFDGGLGLGLSIVKEIVDRHAGQLVLLDADPHGLRVRITLLLSGKFDSYTRNH